MNGALVSIERRPESAGDVLVVRGELDLTGVSTLEDAVGATDAPTVILDLSDLDFIDSAGMRMLDGCIRRLAGEGRALLVVAPKGSRAGWTLRLAGFADDFAQESVPEALLEAARRS